jgi:short-subunit dehydrogenase/catechol 2,3-dioxygenase-like lactoylglutathione lyase family enzyme
MVSVWVEDLDATLERAAVNPAGAIVGEDGSRRACIADPDGVLLELMEDDPHGPALRERPRPDIPAVVRGVTLSVADLAAARHFFGDVLGLEEGPAIHKPEHEAAWGLGGARSERATLWAEDIALELARYAEPAGRPQPAGYRISDQGLLNIAFGFDERAAFEQAYERVSEAGYAANSPPFRLGAWSVVYVNDDQGNSVELLHVEPWYEGQLGFRPRPVPRLAPFAGRTPARVRDARRFSKALVTGAAGGICSELARLAAEDGTELVLLDRDEGGLDRLREELPDELAVTSRPVDLTDLEALDVTAQDIARHPELDLVILGAGLDRAQSLLTFDWRQARDDFSVNTLANLVLLQHLIPAMAARGRGHVTAISSLAGLVGMPYEAPYSGSKAALAAIVESARAELAPQGLTFTAIFPGFVDTAMFRANAFKHPYSLDARDAAERIYMATLRRRETLSFPATERAKLALARALPARVRDRMTRAAMNPPA